MSTVFWLTQVNGLCYRAQMQDSKWIDSLGGTDAVAALTGLKKSAISQWRKRGIPRPWRLYLKMSRIAARNAKVAPRRARERQQETEA